MGGEGRLLVAQCAVLYGVGSEGATMMESNPYSWYMSGSVSLPFTGVHYKKTAVTAGQSGVAR